MDVTSHVFYFVNLKNDFTEIRSKIQFIIKYMSYYKRKENRKKNYMLFYYLSMRVNIDADVYVSRKNLNFILAKIKKYYTFFI